MIHVSDIVVTDPAVSGINDLAEGPGFLLETVGRDGQKHAFNRCAQMTCSAVYGFSDGRGYCFLIYDPYSIETLAWNSLLF